MRNTDSFIKSRNDQGQYRVDASRNFYNKDSKHSLNRCGNTEEIGDLRRLGVTFVPLKESRRLRFDLFFDSLRAACTDKYVGYECLPKPELHSVPIPHDITELDEYSVRGKTIEKIIEDHVNDCFAEQKYLFCGYPHDPIALSFRRFDIDVVYTLTGGRMNHAFVLFDEDMQKAFLFHFDLCITVFTRMDAAGDERLGGLPDADWNDYFNDNFVKASTGVQQHPDVINQNCVPRLRGVKHFLF